MSSLEQDVFNSVQAALLDSECDPRSAVQNALTAVAEFADVESGVIVGVSATIELETAQRVEFMRLAGEAWDARPSRNSSE